MSLLMAVSVLACSDKGKDEELKKQEGFYYHGSGREKGNL